MNLFDILGPVMVGPSSSHTAGAVRIAQPPLLGQGEAVRHPAVVGGEAQQPGDDGLVGAVALATPTSPAVSARSPGRWPTGA